MNEETLIVFIIVISILAGALTWEDNKMERNYDTLTERYAMTTAKITYYKQLKDFENKTYRFNKIMIDNRLDELKKEANDILDAIGMVINE